MWSLAPFQEAGDGLLAGNAIAEALRDLYAEVFGLLHFSKCSSTNRGATFRAYGDLVEQGSRELTKTAHYDRLPSRDSSEGCETTVVDTPLFLLPTALLPSHVYPSLIFAHALFPTAIRGHYVNLLSQGLVLKDDFVETSVGFEGQSRREILADQILDVNAGNSHVWRVVVISTPLPDGVHFPSHPTGGGPGWSSSILSRLERHSRDGYSSLEYGATSSKPFSTEFVSGVVTKWCGRWSEFNNELTNQIQSLETSLLLIAGSELAVARKYADFVQTRLVPTLVRASIKESPALSSALTPVSSTLKPCRNVIDSILAVAAGGPSDVSASTEPLSYHRSACRVASSEGGALKAPQPPLSEAATLVVLANSPHLVPALVPQVLLRYLYIRFHSKLWPFVVFSASQTDAAILKFVNSMNDSPFQISRQPSSHQSGGQVQEDKLAAGQPCDAAVAATQAWLQNRGVEHGAAIVSRLCREGSCCSLLNSIESMVLPHDKFDCFCAFASIATRIAARWLPVSRRDGSALPKPKSADDAVLDSPTLCMTVALRLCSLRKPAAHLRHALMAAVAARPTSSTASPLNGAIIGAQNRGDFAVMQNRSDSMTSRSGSVPRSKLVRECLKPSGPAADPQRLFAIELLCSWMCRLEFQSELGSGKSNG